MKFNKGGMLAHTYAFHRTDLANTGNVTVSLFTGPVDLTTTERNVFNSTTVTAASNGLISHSAARTELLKTRTELGQLYLSNFTQRRIGAAPDERVWMFTQRTEEMTGLAAGTPTFALISLHGGGAAYTAGNLCRTMFACAVGPIGAPNVEFEYDGNIVVGQRYKINDFRFKINNLLGEI